VVDPHQGSGFTALGVGHDQLGCAGLWCGAAGAGLGPQGAQGAVGGKDQGIEAHAASLLMTYPNKGPQKPLKIPNSNFKTSKNNITCCVQQAVEVVVFARKPVKKPPRMQG
jgi:hypothetical protein